MQHLKMDVDAMGQVYDDILRLLEVNETPIFGVDERHNVAALDSKLQELLASTHSLASDELSTWLRYTHIYADHLPTWTPLLNASYEVMLQRHPQNIIERGLLYGLLPETKQ